MRLSKYVVNEIAPESWKFKKYFIKKTNLTKNNLIKYQLF